MVTEEEAVIFKAALVERNFTGAKLKSTINAIKKYIKEGTNYLIEMNQKDIDNENGFPLDLSKLFSIFDKIDTSYTYGKKINTKEVLEKGTVVVINDGDPYVILELSLMNILAGNATVFVNKGYMSRTNDFLIRMIQGALSINDFDNNLVQIFVTEDYSKVLKNYSRIDLVIGIGNRLLQHEVLSKSNNETIVSGYKNYCVYLEDEKYVSELNEFLKDHKANIYINNNLDIDYDEAMRVDDIEEAIAQINFTSSKYISIIISNNEENITKFTKIVKCHKIVVNNIPVEEEKMDINIRDLVIEKTISFR